MLTPNLWFAARVASLVFDLGTFGFFAQVWLRLPDLFGNLAARVPIHAAIAFAFALLVAPGIGIFAASRMSRTREAALDRLVAIPWQQIPG